VSPKVGRWPSEPGELGRDYQADGRNNQCICQEAAFPNRIQRGPEQHDGGPVSSTYQRAP